MFRSQFRFFSLLVIATALPSCVDRSPDETSQVTTELSSDPGCVTDAAVVTINGTGRFIKAPPYGTAHCANGVLVDVNNYLTSNNLHTIVANGGTMPTTQAECGRTQVAAYVWRRETGGGTTYLGSATGTAEWVIDNHNVGFCKPPILDLENEFPGYRPTNTRSFRVGVRARIKGPTDADPVTLQPVHFSTNRGYAYRPLDLVNDAQSLKTALDGVAAGTIHPSVHSIWLQKSSVIGSVMCRGSELQRTAQTFERKAIEKLGASAANLTSLASATDAIINAYCVAGGTEAGLQTAMRNYVTAYLNITADVQAMLGARPKPGDTSSSVKVLAASSLAQVSEDSLGILAKQCAPSLDAIGDYLAKGTLPAGRTAASLLLGNCQGTPTQIATNLGVGANFGGQTQASARDAFAACMAPLDSLGKNQCSDPRASNAPADSTETTNPTPETDESCEAAGLKLINGQCELVVDAAPGTAEDTANLALLMAEEAQRRVEAAQERMRYELIARDAQANRAAYEAAKSATRGAARDDVFNVVVFSATAGLALAFPPATIGAAIAIGTTLLFNGIRAVISHDKLESAKVKQAEAARCTFGAPGAAGIASFCEMGRQMCNPDVAVTAWYSNPGETRSLNKEDRLEHCICQMMDSKYAQFPSLTGSVSSTCPSLEAYERQSCLTDPSGNDDRPVRDQCLKYFRPGPVDAQVWKTRICNAVTCPSGQIKRTDDDGSCSCIQPPTDTGQGLPCRLGLYEYCLEGGECGCTPGLAGLTPQGDDPLCRIVPSRWPGSIDNYFVTSPSDIYVHQFNDATRVAMLRPNRSMVTPRLFRNTFPAVPATGGATLAKLRVKTLVTRTLPVGGNLDLQIYVTSRNLPSGMMPLNHDFMGQVRLNSVAIGSPTNVEIPLNQSLISRAFSGQSFNIEFNLQAPAGYADFVGLGEWSFQGTTTAIPAGSLAPICPEPTVTSGTRPVLVRNPTSTDLGGTPSAPASFPLGPGGSSVVPTWSLVVRDGILMAQ